MNAPLKPWPVPAGRGEAKRAETGVSKVAQLEAEAARLAEGLIDDLATMLEVTASKAAEMMTLNAVPADVRQLAERVHSENTSRAASIRQKAREAAAAAEQTP